MDYDLVLIDSFQMNLNSNDGVKLNTLIDSNGYTVTDTNSVQFQFGGDPDLQCGLDEKWSFAVSGSSIPLAFYNINTLNNTLVVSGHSVTNANGTYTLTKANYTTTSLLTAMTNTSTTNDELFINTNNALFGTYFNVTYDQTLEKYTFTAIGNSNSTFTFGSASTMLKALGFEKATSITSLTTNTLTSSYLIDLSFTKCILITSRDLPTNGVDSDSPAATSITLATAYLTQNAPSIMTFQSYFEIKTTQRSINDITIDLLDENRNYIDMNGLDWMITLDLKKYKMVKKTPDDTTDNTISNKRPNDNTISNKRPNDNDNSYLFDNQETANRLKKMKL